MIKVTVLYPNTPGHQFDATYYFEKHIPLVQAKLGAALKRVEVDQGVAGGTPGASASYLYMFHMNFDSVDAFQAAFGPHADAIFGDVPKYTNLQPVIQISEVKR